MFRVRFTYFLLLAPLVTGTKVGRNQNFLFDAVKEDNSLVVQWLLDHEAEVDVQDEENKTPLMYAAYQGNREIVELLIEAGSDIELTDIIGRSPIHYSARSGKTEIIKLFCELDVNLSKTDMNGMNALHVASEGGFVETVSYLLTQGQDPYITNFDHLTAIHIAAMFGQTSVIQLFFNSSVNIDVKKFANGSTPLMLAVMNNRIETVSYLVDNNADINSHNDTLWTVLHSASYSGNIQFVKLFVDKNASFDMPDINGHTPLYIAVENGYYNIAKYLIDYGSNISHVDTEGNTLMHAAASSGNLKLIKYFVIKKLLIDAKNMIRTIPIMLACNNGHLEAVKYLLKLNSDVNNVNQFGFTAIHAAAASGNVELISYLKNFGVSTDVKDNYGMTPLHYATKYGHLPLVTFIIENTLKDHFNPNSSCNHSYVVDKECFKIYKYLINLKNSDGKSSSYLAAEFGKYEILKYLLELGGDLTEVDKNGKTLLHAASGKGFINIIKLLISQGLNINQLDLGGQSPLFACVKAGQIDAFMFLLSNDADTKIKDNDGQTVMHIAAMGGYFPLVYKLSPTQEIVDSKDKSDKTPAWYAAFNGYKDCLSVLVNSKAQITSDVLEAAIIGNHPNLVRYLLWSGGITDDIKRNSHLLIRKACSQKDGSPEIVEYLIDSFGIVVPSCNGKTLLELATEAGNIAIIELLVTRRFFVLQHQNCFQLCSYAIKNYHNNILEFFLNNGCNVNETINEINKETLLHIAAENGDNNMLNILLLHGADLNAKDKDGRTVVFNAVKWNQFSVLKYLSDKGANINVSDNYKQTPIEEAIKYKNIKMLKDLLKNNFINENYTNQEGKTLYHLAAESGFSTLLEYLPFSKEHFNAKDLNGNEPIHYAVNNVETLKLILNFGVNVNAEGNDKKTPLTMAISFENFKSIKCLIKYGADVFSIMRAKRQFDWFNWAKQQPTTTTKPNIIHISPKDRINTFLHEVQIGIVKPEDIDC